MINVRHYIVSQETLPGLFPPPRDTGGSSMSKLLVIVGGTRPPGPPASPFRGRRRRWHCAAPLTPPTSCSTTSPGCPPPWRRPVPTANCGPARSGCRPPAPPPRGNAVRWRGISTDSRIFPAIGALHDREDFSFPEDFSCLGRVGKQLDVSRSWPRKSAMQASDVPRRPAVAACHRADARDTPKVDYRRVPTGEKSSGKEKSSRSC